MAVAAGAWLLVSSASPVARGALALVCVVGGLVAIRAVQGRAGLRIGHAAGGLAVTLPILAAAVAPAPPEVRLLQALGLASLVAVVGHLVARVQSHGDRERQLGDLKSKFVALAHHELRTPVTVLHGALDSLYDDPGLHLSKQQRAFLEAARGSSSTLACLVEMLTQFDGLQQPGHRPAAPALLGPVIRATVADVSGAFARAGVQLMVEVDDGAGRASVPRFYARIALEQLLLNAAKFNDPGGHAVLRGRLEGRHVELQVEDDGWGIPVESQAMVFEPFYQPGDILARTAGGIGLGLALAHLATSRMQGSITLASAPGKGSTFTVRIPASQPSGLRAP